MPTVNVYQVSEGWRVECECGNEWIFDIRGSDIWGMLSWYIRAVHLSGLDGTHTTKEKAE